MEWTPRVQPYQHHRDQGNFDVPLVPHVDFRWSVGIAFQPSFSTSFPSYLIPWVAGIFESRVAEETVAPKKSPDLACLAILRKRQPSERLRQDKSYDTVLIDWNVYIYLRGVQYTKNNSADLALMIISVQTAGEKIVEGTPKKALVVSSLAK